MSDPSEFKSLDTPPERKHVITIKIQADDWKHALAALDEAAERLTHGPNIFTIGGSPDFSYVVVDHANPAVSHGVYIRQLEAWLDQCNPQEPQDVPRS